MQITNQYAFIIALLTMLITSCTSDGVGAGWRLEEPADPQSPKAFESEAVEPTPDWKWGCQALEDWEADDEFRRVGVEWGQDGVTPTTVYTRRLPVDSTNCGAYAAELTLRESAFNGVNRVGITFDNHLCNRCDEEAELLWIGNGSAELRPDEWRALYDSSTDPYHMDIVVDVDRDLLMSGPNIDDDHRFARLGAVAFWQFAPNARFVTPYCKRAAYMFKNLGTQTRLVLEPGEYIHYESELMILHNAANPHEMRTKEVST